MIRSAATRGVFQLPWNGSRHFWIEEEWESTMEWLQGVWSAGSVASAVLYGLPGLVMVGFFVGLFPPEPGYRRRWHLVAALALLCCVFWPLFALLGLGYFAGHWHRGRSNSGTTTAGEPRRVPRFHLRSLYEESRN